MLTLHLDIQQGLVVIPLPPRPLEHLDLVVVQLPPRRLLELAAADLLARLLLARRLEPGLEARLHAHAQGGVEGDVGLVAAHLGRRVGFCRARRVADREEGLAQGLDLEGARRVGCREDGEGFERGDGVGCRGEEADFVAGEVSF